MHQKQRSWSVQRQGVAKPEGWSRWDQAYQALLTWTSPCHQPSHGQEVTNEDCRLRARFQPAAGAKPDHRTATGTLTDALPAAAVVLVGRADFS
jgi:hypothetical protein